MTPILPALGLAACVVVAARGVALLGPPPVAHRLGVATTAPAAGRERARRSLVGAFFDLLSRRLAGPAMRLLGERRLDGIRRKLEIAGRPMTLEAYAGRKAAFAFLFGSVGVLFLLGGHPFQFLLMTAAGFLWSDVWLGSVTRRRRHRINRDLPDFLDVLAVTVSAGVGFRTAMARVAESLGGPLADEVRVTLHQLELGVSRRAAFEGLRSRNDSEPLSQFVTALVQAEELGSPLADTLVDLAVDMRRSASQEARRRAARTAPRISLVVTLVIVPGALILITVGLFLASGTDLGKITRP